MACRPRGRTALIIAGAGALTGATLLAWDHWTDHPDPAGTAMLWVGWLGVFAAAFVAPARCGCCAGIGRLLGRRPAGEPGAHGPPGNPYRDSEG